MKFYTLNETKCALYGKMLFDNIDDMLSDMNLDAHINRSQSSDDFLVISCDRIIDIKDIEDIVFPYGYAFYADSSDPNGATLYFKNVECIDESVKYNKRILTESSDYESTMERYERWRQAIETEVAYREREGRKPVWKVDDKIFFDNNGHAINHCGYGLLKKVLLNIDFSQEDSKGHIEQEVYFDKPVGYCECVETTSDDDIVYLQRANRRNVTRFVLNRAPEPCNSVFVVLDRIKDSNRYVFRTAYVGTKSGKEPWDRSSTTSDVMFWKNHALVAPLGTDESEDLGDATYWTKEDRKYTDSNPLKEELPHDLSKYDFSQIRSMFDAFHFIGNDFAIVKYNDKWNVLDPDKKFIFSDWLDGIYPNPHGEEPYMVKFDGYYNYMLPNGEFVTDEWFEKARHFQNGTAIVKLDYDGEPYKLSLNGELMPLHEAIVYKRHNILLEGKYVNNKKGYFEVAIPDDDSAHDGEYPEIPAYDNKFAMRDDSTEINYTYDDKLEKLRDELENLYFEVNGEYPIDVEPNDSYINTVLYDTPKTKFDVASYKRICRDLIRELNKKLSYPIKEEFGVDFDDTLAWVEKKRPDLTRGAQIKFARNIIAKRQRETVSALPPTPPATTGIGKVRPDVDPTGILDGVTKIEEYEHCRQDLIIVFDAKSDFDNLRLDDIVYIGDIKSPTSRKWRDRKWKEKDFLKKYWLITGCIYDFYGSDDIILGLHVG